MMKNGFFILSSIVLSWGSLAFAFVPRLLVSYSPTIQSKLEATRRDFVTSLVVGSGALVFFPHEAQAFSQQLDDFAYEPQQQATDGKLDLNAAFVGDYKELRGMFPTAAGKIASHGPYTSVKEIYKIPGLTKNDIDLFKKYEKEFTVHPPGRSFYERINSRVST